MGKAVHKKHVAWALHKAGLYLKKKKLLEEG